MTGAMPSSMRSVTRVPTWPGVVERPETFPPGSRTSYRSTGAAVAGVAAAPAGGT